MFWMSLCFSLTWGSVACNGCRQGFMVAWVCIAAPSPQKNSPLAAQLKIAFRRFLSKLNLGALVVSVFRGQACCYFWVIQVEACIRAFYAKLSLSGFHAPFHCSENIFNKWKSRSLSGRGGHYSQLSPCGHPDNMDSTHGQGKINELQSFDWHKLPLLRNLPKEDTNAS